MGATWRCSKSKLGAFGWAWSADLRLAWWPGQSGSTGNIIKTREGCDGWLLCGRGKFVTFFFFFFFFKAIESIIQLNIVTMGVIRVGIVTRKSSTIITIEMFYESCMEV